MNIGQPSNDNAAVRVPPPWVGWVGMVLPGLVLAGSIVWALGRADLWTSVQAVVADPWGLVMLIDLYAGFLLTGFIVAAIERFRPWAWALLVLSLGLGNVVFAVWAAVRGIRLLSLVARREGA